MDKEEVKAAYSMADIVRRYGIMPNRAGFVNCPFHKGDRDASMKIYHDSYHCFGCGANGDIFSFVQQMDNVSFKDAFLSLGGTYKEPTFQSKLAVYHAKKAQVSREKEKQRILQARKLNNDLIDIYRKFAKRAKPFSDAWCDCMNHLQYQLYVQEVLEEKRTSY